MPIAKKQMPPKATNHKTQTQTTSVSESGSVLDRISPIGFDSEDGIKILTYGRSGSGKTTLWGSFPGPILAVICSGGLKPGELRSIDTPEHRKKVKQVVLHESSELRTLVDHVAATGSFKTVVLDHVSGLQDLTLKEILGLDEIMITKSFGSATQQEYGQSTTQCKELLRALLNLSCNVVIVAQERTFGEEGASEIIKPTVGASLTPSLTGWLNPACDYVVQTFIRAKIITTTQEIAGKKVQVETRGKGVEYCIRTEPHDIYITKFRIPKGHKLPDVIVDPSYDKIMKLIRGE